MVSRGSRNTLTSLSVSVFDVLKMTTLRTFSKPFDTLGRAEARIAAARNASGCQAEDPSSTDPSNGTRLVNAIVV